MFSKLILAGASLDDVFVIVLFSTFINMAQGGSAKIMDFVNIPISIILGILLGAAFGFVLAFLFELAHKRGNSMRQSIKTIILIGAAFLLMAIETWLEGTVSISGLLAVMSMACVIQLRCRKEVSDDLSAKYGRLWLAAEVILFVLVGAAVDIRYTLQAGAMAVLVIFIALIFRSVGVLVCLIGTKLNRKEKLYCIIAYLPKATVQAAIGSVPRYRFGTAFTRTALRKYRPFRCGAFHSDYRSARSNTYGFDLQEIIKPLTYVRSCEETKYPSSIFTAPFCFLGVFFHSPF